jgi:hypothetical protein
MGVNYLLAVWALRRRVRALAGFPLLDILADILEFGLAEPPVELFKRLSVDRAEPDPVARFLVRAAAVTALSTTSST